MSPVVTSKDGVSLRQDNESGGPAVRHLRNEDGVAMVMAVCILVVLGMLAVGITAYTTAGQRTASRSSAGVSAYSLAEAGINNAMSVLAKATNVNDASLLPDNVTAPANVSYYDGGAAGKPPYVKWWGTYDTSSTTWTLTSVGHMRNPTGASRDITRRIALSVHARPKPVKRDPNPAWNYIIATRTGTPGGCDESLNNCVNIQSPMYVVGNLCLNTPSQITGGPLQVWGYTKLDVNTNIGSVGVPVNEVHVRYGCRYKTGGFVDPCTPAQMVWAAPPGADNSPILLKLPTADYASWYKNAAPGPRQPCTTQSGTVPVFDNNATWGPPDGPNGSVPGVFNLTPSASDYSCIVRAGSIVVGELSWDHTAKMLTVRGTFFIDGSVAVNYGFYNVPIRYTGVGTIYVGGTFRFQNTQLCATVTSANDTCDFDHWEPNSTFLVIVANGSGGQVPVGDSIQLVSSSFEGGLFATKAIELDTHSATEGPMLGGNVVFDNTIFARTWPLIDLPGGIPSTEPLEYSADPPSDYSG